MSDDEADLELLEMLRQSLGISKPSSDEVPRDTGTYCKTTNRKRCRKTVTKIHAGVLQDAEYIYNNAIDVFIDMHGTKAAANSVYSSMQQRGYSTQTWSEHELHPSMSQGFTEVDIVNFVFTLDLLNFSYALTCARCGMF